jgi:hypothetical protein
MAFKDLYALSTAGSTWSVKQDFDTVFNWDYDDGRAGMMGLYAKGKEMQWDAVTRIDWSQELDEDNPQGMPEESLPIHMADCYKRMSEKEKGVVRRNFQAWQISQFMQGEQGALICAAKIVTQVPDADSKFYASTQTIDEARHVEAYRSLLTKFKVAYPMTKPLQELIDQTLAGFALGHDLSRHAGRDRRPRARGLRHDSRQCPEPALRTGERLCDAGRVASRRIRAAGAARFLSAIDPEGTRRARRIPARSILSHARPLRRRRAVAASRSADRGMRHRHVRERLHGESSATRYSRASCPS